MAKKKIKERLTPEGILAELEATQRVYGMDFELLEKSRPNVTYIRVIARMNRPAPNSVIGYLKVNDWKPLQRHEYKYDVYRWYKDKMIVVLYFPTVQDYDIKGNTPEHARLTSDKDSHERFFGVINRPHKDDTTRNQDS